MDAMEANPAGGYKYWSNRDAEQARRQSELVAADPMSTVDKINAFPKYAQKNCIARYLAHYELFKLVMETPGSIVECGVYQGAGVLGWAKLSSILEPNNHSRRVIGFDTFSGFPEGGEANDTARDMSSHPDMLREGAFRGGTRENIMKAAELFDMNRHIAHIPKVELVEGDAEKTIPKYVEEHPHLVVSLLYLDFDLYGPTRAALRHFLPRMPKGAVVAFDEFHYDVYPGETMAVADELGIGKLRLRRFGFGTVMAYAVLE